MRFRKKNCVSLISERQQKKSKKKSFACVCVCQPWNSKLHTNKHLKKTSFCCWFLSFFKCVNKTKHTPLATGLILSLSSSFITPIYHIHGLAFKETKSIMNSCFLLFFDCRLQSSLDIYGNLANHQNNHCVSNLSKNHYHATHTQRKREAKRIENSIAPPPPPPPLFLNRINLWESMLYNIESILYTHSQFFDSTTCQ